MPFGMSDVTFGIDANASGATRAIDKVKRNLATITAPARMASQAIDAVGDAMSSAARSAVILSRFAGRAANAVQEVGQRALGAVGKLVAFGGTLVGIGATATVVAGQIGLVAGAIAAIGIAAAPVVAALGGIAIAFGAIIGSGIYAGMNKLSKAFNKAMKAIKPMIRTFGKQFVPLLMDAVRALPKLVKSIINAIGPLDKFKKALRKLGQAALKFLPKLIGFLVDIGRKAIPVFVDVSVFIMKNLVPAFRTLVNWGFKLWSAIGKLIPPFKQVSKTGTSLWNTFMKLVPSVKTLTRWVRGIIGFIQSLVKRFKQGATQGESLRKKFVDLKKALKKLWKAMQPTIRGLKKLGKKLAKTAGLLFGMAMDVVTLAVKLRTKLSPVFQTIIQAVNTLVKWLNKALKAIRKLAGEVAQGASKMDKAWNKVNKLSKETQQTFKTIKKIIRKALNYVWKKIIKPVLKNMKKLWSRHGKEIKQSINQLLSFILWAFRKIKKTASWIWETFGDEIMTYIDTVTKNIVGIITIFVDTILTAFDVFTDILSGNWKEAWGKIKDYLDRTLKRVKKIVKRTIDTIIKIFQSLLNEVLNKIEKLVDAAIKDITAFATDFVNEIEKLVNDVKRWFGKLPDMLAKLVSDFVSVGEDFIRGIIDGIKNIATSLVNTMKNMATDAANGFIDAFNKMMPDQIDLIEKTTIGVGIPGPDYTFGGGSISLPELAGGGVIGETGVAVVHQGEHIGMPGQLYGDSDSGGGTYVDVYVDATGATDPKRVGTAVSSELRSVFNK